MYITTLCEARETLSLIFLKFEILREGNNDFNIVIHIMTISRLKYWGQVWWIYLITHIYLDSIYTAVHTNTECVYILFPIRTSDIHVYCRIMHISALWLHFFEIFLGLKKETQGHLKSTQFFSEICIWIRKKNFLWSEYAFINT